MGSSLVGFFPFFLLGENMRIEEDIKLDFGDVLIRPKRSTLVSRKKAVLDRDFRFKYSKHHWKGVPIVASNMDHTGTIGMAEAMMKYNMLTALCKFEEFPDDKSNYLMKTIGLDDDLDFNTPTWLCIDIANGYTERFFTFINKVREKHSNSIIVAGNVCTPEATEQIILAGADIVKLGIGPGSVCITRKMTGVGYPQLSCIIECADAAHGLGGHAMSDGGCTVPGDIAKAFGAGADFVMLGGMLAGHDECSGEIENGNMIFYGMSSEEAQVKYYGEKQSYRASEGKAVQVPYRGSVEKTIEEILGGLRSSCTYAGAQTIKALPKCTTFVKVNRQLNEVFN
jgi:GMP reductase